MPVKVEASSGGLGQARLEIIKKRGALANRFRACGELSAYIRAMKTILAAVDFSPVTPAVMRTGCALAKALKAKMIVLFVAEPPSLLNDSVAADYAVVLAGIKRDALVRLRKLCNEFTDDNVSIQPRVVTGYSKMAIPAEAKKAHAGLVVLGSHGHGAFYDLVIRPDKSSTRNCSQPTLASLESSSDCQPLVSPVSTRSR